MPPEPKRRLPFKPPRPLSTDRATASKSTTAAGKKPANAASRLSNASAASRRSGASTSVNNTTVISSGEEDEEEDDDDDDEAMNNTTTTLSNRRKSRTGAPATPRRQSTSAMHATNLDVNPAAAILQDDEDAPTVPRALLARLLTEGFESGEDVRIGKEAMSVVEMYVRVFVKEAIARSREEGREKAERGGVASLEEGWLQVEDLERVAPQLMLDF